MSMCKEVQEEIARFGNAVSAANSWQRIAYASVSEFERHGPDYDGAVPPFVAAEIARGILKEAGLYERAEEIFTPGVNYHS